MGAVRTDSAAHVEHAADAAQAGEAETETDGKAANAQGPDDLKRRRLRRLDLSPRQD